MTKKMQTSNIVVAGGYKPNVINFKQGIPAIINFTRKSDQGCLTQVHSQDLNFSKDLPLNKTQTISISTDKPGEFTFSCGMDMFKGKVIIK